MANNLVAIATNRSRPCTGFLPHEVKGSGEIPNLLHLQSPDTRSSDTYQGTRVRAPGLLYRAGSVHIDEHTGPEMSRSTGEMCLKVALIAPNHYHPFGTDSRIEEGARLVLNRAI